MVLVFGCRVILATLLSDKKKFSLIRLCGEDFSPTFVLLSPFFWDLTEIEGQIQKHGPTVRRM
jgi:hypothetical protein